MNFEIIRPRLISMETVTVSKPSDICEAWWKEIAKKVKNAVVFLDEDVSESLNWSGQLEKIIQAGAKDIKEFSSLVNCDVEIEKAVFITGKAIVGVTADILRDIVQSSKFKYIVVITGAHPSVHTYALYRGRDQEERSVMNKIEEEILKWMGNMNYTVEIFYYPVIVVPASENLFLLPKFADMYPIFDNDLNEIKKLYTEFAKGERKPPSCLAELDFCHLPFKCAVAIRHFISCMHSFLQGMNAREEIYSLGHTSRIIATELDSYSPARLRRKTAPNKVSLILVDRTLDLVAPSSYNSKTLMNKVLSLLQRFPGQKIDSAVNMSPICSIHESCDWTLIPGNFAHRDSELTKKVLDLSLSTSLKETSKFINTKISDILNSTITDEKVKKLNSDEPKELKENIKILASDKDALKLHFGLLQQGLAIMECSNHLMVTHLDEHHSMEKMFLQCINDSPEASPLTQIIQIMSTRHIKNITLDEILSLLAYCVSLGGQGVLRESFKYSLINALSQAFIEDKQNLSKNMQVIVGNNTNELSALKTANFIWDRLLSISMARESLKDYKMLHQWKNPAEPVIYKSLLSQVLNDCLTPPPHQLNDLEYRSAGFKDIIKTGFSLFVNVSKPKPRDAALMLIYIVGGVTPCELQELNKLIEDNKSPCKVLIGSSHLTYPSDSMRYCFAEHNLLKVY